MKELVYARQLLPSAERFADRPMLVDGAYTATAGEHAERVLRLTSALRTELGLGRHDRFGVLALNGHAFVELWHAALMGGGVVNPLNLRFAPREIAHVLSDSATRVVFVDAVFAPVIDQVRDAAGVEKVVLIGGGDVPHDLRYEDLLAAGTTEIPEEPDESDAAVLMYTGGTTGLPKGVLLEQRAVNLTVYHLLMSFELDDDDVYLMQTPMFHAASLGGLLAGPATGQLGVSVPFFDPPAVLTAMEQHRVTNTIMVPTMIAMTFAHPDYRAERMATLRKLTYGASPMPRPLLDRLRTEHPQLRLSQGYGMTESAALVSVLTPEDHDRDDQVLASAGRPVVGVTVSIRDADDQPVATGEVGEVCVRGGNFMREYWRRPEETAAAFQNGWYHSGDAGYVDAEGYVYLVDRTKDMIVTGGENVYSTEVEQALAAHPAVAQAAVIGIPDETWGEAVHAVVVLRPDTTATAEELQAHARGLIAGYKVPKSVEFRTEPLPLSGAMKVLKRELRAPYWSDHDRAVH